MSWLSLKPRQTILSHHLFYGDLLTQGFHDFAEFIAEDVGTVDSGLNSVVLANNNEMILLPLNEPTYGTKRKSQIQTYLGDLPPPPLFPPLLPLLLVLRHIHHYLHHKYNHNLKAFDRP